METRKSEKSSKNGWKKNIPHTPKGCISEYPFNGVAKLGNFSQKLHAVSHASESAKSKQSQRKWTNSSINNLMRERINTEINTQTHSGDDWKDLLSSSSSSDNLKENKSERKYCPKRLNKYKLYNKDQSQDKTNISANTTVRKYKKHKKKIENNKKNITYKKNRPSDASRKSSQENSAFWMKTNNNIKKGRLISGVRTPNSQLLRPKNNQIIPSKKSNHHRKLSKNEKVS